MSDLLYQSLKIGPVAPGAKRYPTFYSYGNIATYSYRETKILNNIFFASGAIGPIFSRLIEEFRHKVAPMRAFSILKEMVKNG